jgi:hypothetical protein
MVASSTQHWVKHLKDSNKNIADLPQSRTATMEFNKQKDDVLITEVPKVHG